MRGVSPADPQGKATALAVAHRRGGPDGPDMHETRGWGPHATGSEPSTTRLPQALRLAVRPGSP